MFRENDLKKRLKGGDIAFGITLTLGSSVVAELLGLAGCDFVLIDAEHGISDDRAVLYALQALGATGAYGIVRLASSDRVAIKRVLDRGAEALMIPCVNSAEEAVSIIEATRYPPSGTRGYAAGGIRASDYGLQVERYLRDYASSLLIAVMIESAEGLKNVEAIAAVEGVDVIQVGANDLSYDMGLGEDLSEPALVQAISRIERATLANGKILGGAVLPGDTVQDMRDRGYRLITLGRDAGLLLSGVQGKLENARRA